MKKDNCWYYNGECLYEPPEGYYGFLYRIIVIDTDSNVTWYFGKKALEHKQKTYLSKKAKLLPENKGKRVLRTTKDSGWLNYYGSCQPLLKFLEQDNIKEVRREILSFHPTKMDLTYREIELLINEQVLFRDDCWNANIASKFFKGRITKC